jgi:hypothetical protein
MSQRVKTSARGLVLPRSSSPENGHLRKNSSSFSYIMSLSYIRYMFTLTTLLVRNGYLAENKVLPKKKAGQFELLMLVQP